MRAARGNAPASARSVALRLLARRDYSRCELEQRLRARGVAPNEIGAALDEFEALGYLSDARYARTLVARRIGRFGKRAIARDLQDKGIAGDAAKGAIDALVGRDELADATAVWERRFGRPPVDDRDKARQVRFLVARGFTVALALKVLRAAGAYGDSGSD